MRCSSAGRTSWHVVALGALCGCAAEPIRGGGSAPRAAAELQVELDGVDEVWHQGLARSWGSFLQVAIADRPISCDALPRSDHSDPNALGFSYVLFDLARGPGGRYFDGRPVGTHVWFHSAKLSAQAEPYLASVSVETFTPRAGARVRGGVHVEARSPKSAGRTNVPETRAFHVEGTFDVPLCVPSSVEDAPVPESAGEAPLSATLVEMERFVPESALAIVQHDASNDVDFVLSVEIFAARVDCATLRESLAKLDSLRLGSFGLSARTRAVAAPMAASASFHFNRAAEKRPIPRWLGRPPDTLGAQGWVTFDSVGFAEGATIRGRAHFDGVPLALDGRFEARVCRW
jgi:hypothetical protein